MFSIYLGLFLLWAVFITRLMSKMMAQVSLKKKKQDEIQKPNHGPFIRTDVADWPRLEIMIGAVFLLPIKLIVSISNMALLSVACLIFGRAEVNKNCPLPSFNRAVIYLLVKLTSRVFLLCSGIYWINEEHQSIPAAYKQKESKAKIKKAPFLISNHVTWLDIMYFGYKAVPSFLAKYEISKYPLFGVTARGMQSIFVQRSKTDDKETTRYEIEQRVKAIQEGKNLPQICIFPEGTTSSGEFLISFKKGAFEPLCAVQIHCLKYSCKDFNPALDWIGQGCNFLVLYCLMRRLKLEVTIFEPFEPQPNWSWETFAGHTKQIMLRTLALKNSESGFRDKIELYKELELVGKTPESNRKDKSN